MRHRIAFLLMVLAFTAQSTRSSSNDTTETNLPILENTRLEALGPDTFPPGVNPLTGLTVADPSVLLRRPIIAKISNAPPLVRPQAGLNAADLVFEHYAEGGLTRFSAIYYSQAPEHVGSIRSARLIDYELMPMYQGLLAYSGASIGVEDRLNTSEFSDRLFKGVLYGWPHYWRDEAIPVPHNMFTNAAALWQLADETGINAAPDLHGMAFHADPAANIDAIGPASLIDLRYRATRVEWAHDPATGRYLRSADGLGHYDGTTLEQVSAANVVIIYAEHTLTDIIESQWQGSISYSIEIKLWFEGDAVLFRDGQRFEGRWLRPTREDLLALRTRDGELLYLKPGNTWFQVMPLPEQFIPGEESVQAT